MGVFGTNSRRAWLAQSRLQRNLAARCQFIIEALEQRTLLSAAGNALLAAVPPLDTGTLTSAGLDISITPQQNVYTPDYTLVDAQPQLSGGGNLAPFSTAAPTGLTVAQVRQAYGVNQAMFGGVVGNGAGQTIAIVDAQDYPTAATDLHAFDLAMGLPDPPSFTRVNEYGGSTLPPSSPTGDGDDWEVEEALDVEWAHAMAPGANILLVEASSATDQDLIQTSVNYARSVPGVVAVTMSFGRWEESTDPSEDSYFTTPSGHNGVTFLASTGDDGAPGEYPSFSPNVLAVGGTSLSVDAAGDYLGESGWAGSGGGISDYEAQPAYQTGVVTQSTTTRTTPDVAFDADPETGVAIYDSYDFGTADPWVQVGGTSVSSPSMAGLIAVADQGRVLNGFGTLDGRTQTMPALYSLPAAAFHDILSGNNGFAAGPGYDLVTGLGSPVANVLLPDLANYATAPHLAFAQNPSTIQAGGTINPAVVVNVDNADGSINTSDHSNVTLAISSGPNGGTLQGNVTVRAVNGVATFNNLSLTTAGNYTLTATDANGNLAAINSIVFTVNPAAATKLAFVQQPTNGGAGLAITPAVTVAVEDQFGNIETGIGSNSSVTLAVASGPGVLTGTPTVAAVGGVATLGNLFLPTPGNYTLSAAAGNLTGATSNSFTIAQAISTTTVVTSSNSPANFAQAVTFTATVTPSSGSGETGSVQFMIDGGNAGSPVTVSGNAASYTTAPLSVGGHAIVAIYSGDGSFATSTSATFTQTIAKAVISTAITSNGSAPSYGQPVTFTATVTPGSGSGETGTLQFKIDGSNVGSPVTISGNTASYSATLLSAGNHTVAAVYSGDGNFAASSSATFMQTIAKVAPSHSFGTLTTLGSGNLTAGEAPLGDLVLDASGDLFGTCSQRGAYNLGTVFEIVHGSGVMTPLVSFDGTNGTSPQDDLIMDSSGNLFGTAAAGGANGDGTVFEIVQGSGVITVLATFDVINGQGPTSVIEDSNGDLFGTTEYGGNTNGTFFEIAPGSGVLTTLAMFNGTNGNEPNGLIMDAAGNFFGTTIKGGANNDGTVFEIARDGNIITTLASFNGTNGSGPNGNGSMAMDSAGDIFGTTAAGGDSNRGTVFEVAYGSWAISTLASLSPTSAAGCIPAAGVTLDSSGDIFGTNYETPTSYGAVFEIAKGGGNPLTLATFNAVYGPEATLLVDATGDLFGTTWGSGAYGGGEVFEVPASPTGTAITSNNPSPSYGQPVTFTAKVTPNVGVGPTGTVQFQIDGDNVGNPVALSGGTATYTTAALSAGSHSIVAVYSGDNNYDSTSSPAITQNVTATGSAVATTTAVTSSSDSPGYGQPVTFTATVSPVSGSGETGSVQFQIDDVNAGSPVLLSGNTAAYTTAALSAGSHTLVAFYSGDGQFIDSVSPAFTQNVTGMAAAITVTASNGTTSFGQPVTFTATVTPASGGGETGSVQFQIDGGNVGSPVALSGNTASYTTAALNAGSHAVVAVYSGDSVFAPSASAAFTQNVAAVATTTVVTSSDGAAIYGEALTFTATVTPASGSSETGSVQFQIDGGNVGSPITLTGNSASYTTAALSAGSHNIVAIYRGDDNFTGSSSPTLTQTVTLAWIGGNSAVCWNPATQTLTLLGNATLIGDPGIFGVHATIADSSAGQLVVDTQIADGGDGAALVHLAAISGNGTMIVNGTDVLVAGNFSQSALVNNGTVEIDGAGALGQITGSGNITIGNGLGNNTVQLVPTAIANSVANTQTAVFISAGSTLDITDNTLLLNYGTGSSPLAAVQAAVAAGTMISSMANAGGQYTVGYADATEIVTIPSGNVQVMYTLTGDGVLTGTANFRDFSALQNSYNQSGKDWAQGDFNHDGTVNFLDYSLLQNAYNLSVKLTPTLSWAPPTAVGYGTVLSGGQLNATANVPGTFAYSPAPGTALAMGNYALSVTFTPSDTTDYYTVASSVNLTVTKAATTTVVTSSSAAPNFAQAVTFTATVTPASGSGATGTVQFQIDGYNAGTPVPLSGNTASYTITTLPVGGHLATAVYSGDAHFAGSTAPIFNQNVDLGTAPIAPTVTYTLVTNDDGTGHYCAGHYAVYATDTLNNGGISGYEINLTGTKTLNNYAPQGFYDDGTGCGTNDEIGFTFYRTSNNVSPATATQDIIGFDTGGEVIFVYGFGQTAGNLANEEAPGSTGPAASITQPVYGAPLLMLKGTFTGTGPTFGNTTNDIGNVFKTNYGSAAEEVAMVFNTVTLVQGSVAQPAATTLHGLYSPVTANLLGSNQSIGDTDAAILD